MCTRSAQSYENIIAILKSLPSVKDVRIEVSAALFGVEWAAGPECEQEKYVGTISSWKKKGESLYVRWEGWTRNADTPLTSLDKDSAGASLELKLLAYGDGRPAPTRYTPPPAARGQEGPGGSADSEDEAEEEEVQQEEAEEVEEGAPDQVDLDGQAWKLRTPTYVKSDRRTLPRSKTTLAKGDMQLNTIAEFCEFLTPDSWWDRQLTYTNVRLLGTDKINAKLTRGELKRWWGYSLALSIHTGIPLEKMWSDTPMPNSILPPPRMGRHGMPYARWKKIRANLTFGPSDEESLRADNWSFIRGMIDMYNTHRSVAVCPGWLLTMDELMVAWRGRQGVLDPNKCPKISWVPRKPEPLGVEHKCTADALSGMMLFLEICEGKEAHKEQVS